jgi:succinoglycan biosynthesis protein ExoV
LDLFYYRGSEPNFGDELNHWMWPRLIQDCWDDQDNTLFVGIGSVLESRLPKDKLKIIFGAGYGGYRPPPKIDENWKILFVRGKRTAEALGIEESAGIGDSAILLRSFFNKPLDKKHPVSFMPHWKSLTFGNWELAAKLAGINFIDPRQDVEIIISQILASDLIIAEAMHGAIVADALRVPWIPLEPIDSLNRMKWFDWASALNLELTSEKLTPSSMPEKIADFFDAHNLGNAKKIRKKTRFLKGFMPQFFAEQAANRLTTICKQSPNLSKDSNIELSHEKMQEKLYELVKFIGKGKILV